MKEFFERKSALSESASKLALNRHTAHSPRSSPSSPNRVSLELSAREPNKCVHCPRPLQLGYIENKLENIGRRRCRNLPDEPSSGLLPACRKVVGERRFSEQRSPAGN
jgi:hypothetical protein